MMSSSASPPLCASEKRCATRKLAFLLTLFNARLGWWFPNPQKSQLRRISPRFSLRYLCKELLGGADDRSNYLMLSDGGHFENLAAYELVRRRCRVIIISDAEADENLRFEGLGSLIRMCQVDFGANIIIRVDAIAKNAEGWSAQRHAIGRIHYRDGTKGVLIYMKASMSGKEGAEVRQYHACHPTFPHESTGNQFYGEDQFESYRALGKDIVGTLFDTERSVTDLLYGASTSDATPPG